MNFFTHFGRYIMMLKGMFNKPENAKLYWKEFMKQCADIGVGSLGIVCIISLFMGAVSTVQTAYQLVSPLISKTTIAQIVRDTVILEFAPTLVCIVLAGVIGSKIASELGNMRVSEQIDALEIMGVNSANYLILPKITAFVAFMPVLVIFSMFLGMIGGYVICYITNTPPPETYIYGIQAFFNEFFVWYSILKSMLFGFIIASVAAYFGYYAKGGSLDVGKASTDSVVMNSILILVVDLAFTQLVMG